jgi:sterol desaturase/sphingolipid hydroxylase (fatty acid hydroxylase superfamily)
MHSMMTRCIKVVTCRRAACFSPAVGIDGRMLHHYVNAAIFGVWLPHFRKLWIAFACCIALEIILPGEKHSIISRLRGALFWTIYIIVGISSVQLAQHAMTHLDIRPFFAFDLSGATASSNWIVRALGYTVLPFLGVLVFDFFYYWFHRAQHALSALWYFHRTHHAIEELNAINSYHHVTEELFRIPLVLVPAALLVQINTPQVMAVVFFLSISAQMIHSDTRLSFGPLRYLIAEPRYHRLHHSIEPRHFGRNFASLFPLIDVVFRTAYFPAAGEAHKTGLCDTRETRTIRQYLIPGCLPANESLRPKGTGRPQVLVDLGAPTTGFMEADDRSV